MAKGMVRAFASGREGPGFETACARIFSYTLSVHQAGNEYLVLQSGGGGVKALRKRRHPISVTQLPIQLGSLAARSPTQPLAKGKLSPFLGC